MTPLAAAFLCVSIVFAILLLLVLIGADDLKRQLKNAKETFVIESESRQNEGKLYRGQRDRWRELCFRQIDEIDRLRKLLHGTEEALGFNIEEREKLEERVKELYAKVEEKRLNIQGTEDVLHQTQDDLRTERKNLANVREDRDKALAELSKAKEKSLPYVPEWTRRVKFLERLFERMRKYNPGQHGNHECCPCVNGMKKEYVDVAIGPDPENS